jgi:hypothetical protein
VKTLQDDAGKALDLSNIVPTTASALRSKTVLRGPNGSRGSGVESTFYEVRARLVSAKLEEDNDIHLVIKGITTSGTMIVEFPLAPTCTANATTGAKARMKNARNAFGAACGVPGVSTFTKLQGQSDDPRYRLLRLPTRSDGGRAERDRAPSRRKVHGRHVRRGVVEPSC